jgi:hypothetical protein
MSLQPSHNGRKWLNLDQNTHSSSEETPRTVQRPALHSIRFQCKKNNFALQQCSEENPLTFLQHLKDAIRKHTTVDPESQVREILLKDKFLTQSAPDIHKKLKVYG